MWVGRRHPRAACEEWVPDPRIFDPSIPKPRLGGGTKVVCDPSQRELYSTTDSLRITADKRTMYPDCAGAPEAIEHYGTLSKLRRKCPLWMKDIGSRRRSLVSGRRWLRCVARCWGLFGFVTPCRVSPQYSCTQKLRTKFAYMIDTSDDRRSCESMFYSGEDPVERYEDPKKGVAFRQRVSCTCF